MQVDPVLVGIWITGWTLARHTPPPVDLGDCWRVDVGWPDQKARYVFARDSDRFARLADIAEPHVFLKAFLPVEEMSARLSPERWSLDPQRQMMTCDAMTSPQIALPAGYKLEHGDRTVSVFAGAALVASGQVVRNRDFAIFDSIKVDPAHQRLGLGRAMMGALTGLARDLGAPRGVLVATAEGAALYRQLGWHDHAPYASAVPNIQR